VASSTIHDPYFLAVTAPKFRRADLADLAAGRCAAIRVPALFSPEMCEEVMRALEKVEFDSYDPARISPTVMRCGVGVSDHRDRGTVAESYWPAVADSQRKWRDLELAFDPFGYCREALQEEWPHSVRVGQRGGRPMGEGVAREPNNGFQVHFDEALREFSGNLLDDDLVGQFAFNLYLSVPESGGETVVWRHRWQPADETFRLPHSTYGYSPDVVGDAESFELKPSIGEALLFDPRNFHAVRPSNGTRRVALGFAVGLSVNGELLTWG
jgi:hypothetical protein